MAHLIEEYAKTLGVKIGKPYLVDHFFPTIHNKYITIHCDNKIDAKYYEYFPQVLDLIRDILHKNGIAIYQVGGSEDPKLNTDANYLITTYKQSFYLIKNSLLHVGIDSLPVHIASAYGIPTISLYSHIYASHAKPYWNQDKATVFESEKNGNKPSYSYSENPKTIRSIKPEWIAQAILDKLNINFKIPFETKKIGSMYHIPVIEVVPNFMGKLENNDKVIYIRADLNFDLNNIAYWCGNYDNIIISDKEIDINLLAQFRNKIKNIFFKINDATINPLYLEAIKKLKLNFTLCTENESILNKLRNFYFDYRVELDDWKIKAKKCEKIKSKFFTSKILVSNGLTFPSESHLKLNKKLDIYNETIEDDVLFWKDVEHFLLYENTKIQRGQNSELESDGQERIPVPEQGVVRVEEQTSS